MLFLWWWLLLLIISCVCQGSHLEVHEFVATTAIQVLFRCHYCAPKLAFDLLDYNSSSVYQFLLNPNSTTVYEHILVIERGRYLLRIPEKLLSWKQSILDVFVIPNGYPKEKLLVQTIILDQQDLTPLLTYVDLTFPIWTNEEWYYQTSSIPAYWYSNDTTGWKVGNADEIPLLAKSTHLLKKWFEIYNADNITSFSISIRYQFNCLLYLNDYEIFQDGISGELTNSTVRSTEYTESYFKQLSFPLATVSGRSYLREGLNLIAIAFITNTTISESDHFDCTLSLIRNPHAYRLGDYETSFGSESQETCDDLYLQVTFPNRRHEWLSSLLIESRSPRNLTLHILARNSEGDDWTSLNEPLNLLCNLPIHRIFLWTDMPWNQYLLQFSIGPEVCEVPKLLAIGHDVRSSIEQLKYPSPYNLITHQSFSPIHPISRYYTSFKIIPSLPDGLYLDTYYGVIWGSVNEPMDMVFTIQALSLAREVKATTLTLKVTSCPVNHTLISFSTYSEEEKMYGEDLAITILRADDLSTQDRIEYEEIRLTSNEHVRCMPDGEYILHYPSFLHTSQVVYIYIYDELIFLAKSFLDKDSTDLSISVYAFIHSETEWSLVVNDSPVLLNDLSSWTASSNQFFSQPYAHFQKQFVLNPLHKFTAIALRVTHIGGLSAYVNGELIACIQCSNEEEISSLETVQSLFSIIISNTPIVEGSNNLTLVLIRPPEYQGNLIFDAFGVVSSSIIAPVQYTPDAMVPNIIQSLFEKDSDIVFSPISGLIYQWSASNSLGVVFNAIQLSIKSFKSSYYSFMSRKIPSAYGDTLTLTTDIGSSTLFGYCSRKQQRDQFAFIGFSGGFSVIYELSFLYDSRFLMNPPVYYNINSTSLPPLWTLLEGTSQWSIAISEDVPQSTVTTTYFVVRMNLLYMNQYPQFTLSFPLAAGTIVYLNGVEVIRLNLPLGLITANTSATHVYSSLQTVVWGFSATNPLVQGLNVFAFEMHRYNDTDIHNPMTVMGEYVMKGQSLHSMGSGVSRPAVSNNSIQSLFDSHISTSLHIPSQCEDVDVIWDYGALSRIIANEYTLIASDECNSRHPSAWTLSGSNDGINWYILDERRNQTFSYDFETKSYVFNNTQAYQQYRLHVDSCENQLLPLQNCQQEGFQLAEFTLSSTLNGSCPLYGDSGIRLDHGETIVFTCPQGFSGYIKASCNNQELTADNHCVINQLFSLPVDSFLTVPYQLPIVPLPMISNLNVVLFSVEPALPSTMSLVDGVLSGSYDKLTPSTFTITGWYRHAFTSSETITLSVDDSPCAAIDGFNATHHGGSSTMNCTNGSDGYVKRWCYSGHWSEPENHCYKRFPFSLHYSPSVLSIQRGTGVFLSIDPSPYEVDSYSISPIPPSSLNFSPATGLISGTLLSVGIYTYTVTARIDVTELKMTVEIQVLPAGCGIISHNDTTQFACIEGLMGYRGMHCVDGVFYLVNDQCSEPPPTILYYTVPSIEFTVGKYSTTTFPYYQQLSHIHFTVSPPLPVGLELDEKTGVISGVPIKASNTRTYTVTASNDNGSISTSLLISVFPPKCHSMAGMAASEIGTLLSFPCESGQLSHGSVSYLCIEVDGEARWTTLSMCISNSTYLRDRVLDFILVGSSTLCILLLLYTFFMCCSSFLIRPRKELPRNTFIVEMNASPIQPVRDRGPYQYDDNWSVC